MRARALIRMATAALAGGLVTALLVLPTTSAQATSRVSVSNQAGRAQIDQKYLTSLRLGGSGFQSVKGGFGGIYVLFGTVSGNWRPSAGGSGRLLYVPDSQSRSNAGYQKFVSFPGSSTGGDANGGTISSGGSWSTTINVPGSTFKAVDSKGRVQTVDCRKVTCGVITIGAHGVKNARNETFTPVSVGDLYGGRTPTTNGGGATTGTGTTTTTDAPAAEQKPVKAVKPALAVDRASAVAGRVLAFTGKGLPAGRQVSLVLDDGVAGVGPITVGNDGRLAGVISVPADVGPGTHTLRVVGMEKAPKVSFAIATAAGTSGASTDAEPVSAGTGPTAARASWQPVAFAAVAATVLLVSLLLTGAREWRRRRAA